MKLFRKAILVIHGFCGGLVDNEFLVNQLETNSRFDVYAWTLPHHEKNIMLGAKYQDWIEGVERQIKFLLRNGYHSIYVVGHSMGGVIASYLSTKYPQIKKLVLLSPAFDYLSLSQYKEDFLNLRKIPRGEVAYHRAIVKAIKAPYPVMNQFRKLVKEYKGILPKVKVETLVLFGEKDEVVPYSTLEYVKTHIGSKNATYTTVTSGRHVLVRSRRQEEVISYIEAYLKGGLKWKRMKKSRI